MYENINLSCKTCSFDKGILRYQAISKERKRERKENEIRQKKDSRRFVYAHLLCSLYILLLHSAHYYHIMLFRLEYIFAISMYSFIHFHFIAQQTIRAPVATVR